MQQLGRTKLFNDDATGKIHVDTSALASRMSLFSQRKGLRPLLPAVQRDTLNDHLRNRLWTGLSLCVWDKRQNAQYEREVKQVLTTCWIDYLKQPIHTLPHRMGYSLGTTEKEIRDWFFDADWWQALDLIEFVLKRLPQSKWQDSLRSVLNVYLAEENSAYRIVAEEIVEITDETEIKAIESVIAGYSGGSAAREHISRALELLGDKKNPDYRNSVKESISAVEAVCRQITGKTTATLGDAIKLVDRAHPMHGAFKEALSKLYGYSSDQGGIRHSLNESGSVLTFADAKFMVVVCSAYINYIFAKCSEGTT